MSSNGIKVKSKLSSAVLLIGIASLVFSAESMADSGLYIGGSVGSAGIELEVSDTVDVFVFDEDASAWKAFLGYKFDLPFFNLGIEGGYVDLGAPSGDFAGTQIELAVDGLNVFGVLGFDLGPVGVFAKAGMISWDATATIDGFAEADDGSDPAYGVGISFGIGSIQLRAEYELFDIDEADDVTMISAGLVWIF